MYYYYDYSEPTITSLLNNWFQLLTFYSFVIILHYSTLVYLFPFNVLLLVFNFLHLVYWYSSWMFGLLSSPRGKHSNLFIIYLFIYLFIYLIIIYLFIYLFNYYLFIYYLFVLPLLHHCLYCCITRSLLCC